MIGIEYEAVGGNPCARSWEELLKVEVANENLTNRKPASAKTKVSCIAQFSEIADSAIVMFGRESQLEY